MFLITPTLPVSFYLFIFKGSSCKDQLLIRLARAPAPRVMRGLLFGALNTRVEIGGEWHLARVSFSLIFVANS